jgi:hypothetical protein
MESKKDRGGNAKIMSAQKSIKNLERKNIQFVTHAKRNARARFHAFLF